MAKGKPFGGKMSAPFGKKAPKEPDADDKRKPKGK